MAIPLGITNFPSYGSMLPYGGCAPPSRHACQTVDELLGRKVYETPSHLTRSLYVPHHSDKAVHLPVYDVTDTYKTVTKGASLGSTEYKMRLCLMQKPTWNSADADVQYLTSINATSGAITIDERSLGIGQEVEMMLPQNHNGTISMRPTTPTRGQQYTMSSSYPIPPTIARGKPVHHPYFEIAMNGETKSPVLEWQTYPDMQGALCYMLVDKAAQLEGAEEEEYVKAIYHHAGIEPNMPKRYSEGFLLLPDDSDPRMDIVVTSSVIGLLWSIRNQSIGGEKKTSMSSAFKKVFRRL